MVRQLARPPGGSIGTSRTREAPGGGQGNKGVWWMPRCPGPMKDVASCVKPRGAAHRL